MRNETLKWRCAGVAALFALVFALAGVGAALAPAPAFAAESEGAFAATGLAAPDQAAAQAPAGTGAALAPQADATIDIPIEKVWVGMPVEDVTIHLHRALFPLAEESRLTDAYVQARGEGIWHPVGLVDVLPRADFVDANGQPKANEADGSSSKVYPAHSSFSKNLPMYVEQDGVTYRAVYRLVEDDHSDAYVPSYHSVQPGGAVQEGDNIFIDSGLMVITNTVVATNQANIAAVKQLVGRAWLDTDEFSFQLVPLGKALYNADGTMQLEQRGGVLAAKLAPGSAASIPMPEADPERLATYDARTRTARAKATIDAPVVAEGERLARFGAIEFNASDLVYDPRDKHLQGDFFYEMSGVAHGEFNGFVYDDRTHVVHVKVRENRTDQLQITIAYDETDQSNTATGTQFTPVFTNHYFAEAAFAGGIDAHIMGRTWRSGDALDFTLRALGGAAFVPWDERQLVQLDHLGQATDPTDGQTYGEAHYLAAGKQVLTRDGAIRMRLVPGAAAGTSNVLVSTFAQMKFTLDDLAYVVGEGGAKDPRDNVAASGVIRNKGGVAKAGLKYGRFMYAVSQSNVASDAGDLARDADTEYAQAIVVDNGDGTLYVTAAIFEDRYASVPRYTPGADGHPTSEPARSVTFVNQATRDISVEKRWVGVADADVAVKLQQTAAASPRESDWADVPGRTLSFTLDGLEAGPGYSFAAGTFERVPMFLSDGDDADLNDKPLAYRVVEIPGTGFESAYGQALSKAPVVAEPGEVQVITNTSTYTASGTARVSVVMELTGRPWLSPDPSAANYSPNVPEGDVYEFDLVALGKGAYDAQGNISLTDGKVNDSTLVKDAQGRPVTEGVKLPVVPAFARTVGDSEHYLSDSSRLADFGNVNLTLEDMTRLPDGRMVGDYFYRIVATPRDDALAWVYNGFEYRQVGADGKVFGTEGAANEPLAYADASEAQRAAFTWVYKGVRYDKTAHELRIHFEDNGTGAFTPQVTYDGNPLGHAVPVFVGAYDSVGYMKAHVVKHIEGRAWNAGDRFEFRLASVGGAAFDPNEGQEGTGDVEAAVWTTPVMADSAPGTATLASGDRSMVIGEGVFHLADLVPATQARPAAGQFVYQIQEIDPTNPATMRRANPTVTEKVADLAYDTSIVYLRVMLQDNFDGTISHVNEYFRDAACSEPLVDEAGRPYVAWVDAAGNVVDESAAAGAGAGAGVEQVVAAHFTNEPAATSTAQVAAVAQMIGRVILPTDELTVELTPLGKARYDESGDVITREGALNGETVRLPDFEPGSAATIPMPGDATGSGSARIATATATLYTPVVAEGERLASFDDIVFSLGDVAYNPAEKRMAGDFYYLLRSRVPESAEGGAKDGITYDTSEHIVHVLVREAGPNMMGCYVYYDESDAADTATGTQFTPVFTNRYAATGERAVAVSTTMRGRDWNYGEAFDYELRAMGGAPFAYGPGVVRLDQNGMADGRYRDAYLDEGTAVVTRLGAMRIRLRSDEVVGGYAPITGQFPALVFTTDNLPWRVGAEGAADPADRYGDRTVTYAPDYQQYEGEGGTGAVVPEGMAYGKFTYAVNEVVGDDADVAYDTVTEYAQVLAIDRGDGTLDVTVHIYDDRYGTAMRYDAGNGLPVTAAQFVNVAESDDFAPVTASATWLDAAGKQASAPEGAALDMVLVGRTSDGTIARAHRVAGVDSASGWQANWDAPKNLSYALVVGAPDGYAVEVAGPNAAGTGEDVGTAFGVTVRPASGLDVSGRVAVSAVWDDDNDRDGKRLPFELALERRVGAGAWERVDAAAVGVAGYDGELGPYAAADAAGAAYTYRVAVPAEAREALEGAGYALVVSQATSGRFVVACVRVPDTLVVRATVRWLDLDDAAHTRPEAVRLVLLANGALQGGEVVATAADFGGWTQLWRAMPVRDAAGVPIDYEVAVNGLAGYDVSVQPHKVSGSLLANTVVAKSRSVSKRVSATLSWRDANGKTLAASQTASMPPVTLQLVRTAGGKVSMITGSDRIVRPGSAGPVAWTGLDAYDADGNEVFYSVTQKGLTGFTPLYVPSIEKAGAVDVVVINRANGDGVATGAGKAPQNFKAKAKKKVLVVKRAKLARKPVRIKRAKAFAVSGAHGALAFAKVSGSARVKVTKAGNVVVKRGTLPGAYKLQVKVTAAGDATHTAASKTVKVKVRVK